MASLNREKTEKIAERFFKFAIPDENSSDFEIRRRAKIIASVMMFCVIMFLLGVAWQHELSTKNTVEAAVTLQKSVKFETKKGTELTVGIDQKAWHEAQSNVKEAWMQGQFYNSPQAQTLKITDTQQKFILERFNRQDIMR